MIWNGKDRRRRLKPPVSILLAGGLFLLLPFANYFYLKHYFHIKTHDFTWIFMVLDPFSAVLLILPFFIGIGLLKVRKWGYWSLFAYSITLLLHNAAGIIISREIFQIGIFIQSFIGLFIILFFLRKDISAPYFKMYPRGWRGQKRSPIVMDVILDGTSYKTKDISETGIYAEWAGCAKNLGDAVSIEMGGTAKVGGIVRIDENGVGIAFRKS